MICQAAERLCAVLGAGHAETMQQGFHAGCCTDLIHRALVGVAAVDCDTVEAATNVNQPALRAASIMSAFKAIQDAEFHRRQVEFVNLAATHDMDTVRLVNGPARDGDAIKRASVIDQRVPVWKAARAAIVEAEQNGQLVRGKIELIQGPATGATNRVSFVAPCRRRPIQIAIVV